MRQRTLRVFEVDNYENLKNIIQSKYELIKNHFFLLKEKNEDIENLLKENNLSYFIENSEGFTFKKEIIPQIKVIEKEIVKKVKPKTVIFDKIIRSGEEIETDENLIFLQRINAGAKIVSLGNIEIYAECEGTVICDGEYLIVKKNKKGMILFKGTDIGKVEKLTFFSENMKKVLE